MESHQEVKILTLLNEILKFFSIKKSEIVKEKREEGVTFNIKSKEKDIRILIGKEGKTLAALELLLNAIISKGEKIKEKILLDIQDYRKQHKERLTNLAKKTAQKVKKIKKKVALPPMNSYDRRIIHITLQNNPDVVTQSEGEGKNRKVVIIPKENEKCKMKNVK